MSNNYINEFQIISNKQLKLSGEINGKKINIFISSDKKIKDLEAVKAKIFAQKIPLEDLEKEFKVSDNVYEMGIDKNGNLTRPSSAQQAAQIVKNIYPKLERRKSPIALQSHAHIREESFIQKAAGKGLTRDDAQELYKISRGSGRDAVTGFDCASDIDPTMYLATQLSEKPSAESYCLKLEIALTNLGGLNAEMGHNESDAVYSDISRIVDQHLSRLDASITRFRDGGKLVFIVASNRAKEEAEGDVKIALQEAQIQVKKVVRNFHLDEIPNPREKDKKGIGIDFSYAEVEPAAVGKALKSAPDLSEEEASENPQWSSSLRREQQFLAFAAGKAVDAKTAEGLYSLTGGGSKDSLTGLEKRHDRTATVQNVQDLAGQTSIPAYYVEVDVRNLSGLNQHLGRDKANDVFRQIVSITQEHIKKVKGVESVGFRHGGDEFSFVIAAKSNDASGDEVRAALNSAMHAAKEQIASQFVQLMDIPHPKHPEDPSKSGTGIVFGISEIREEDSVDEIFKKADQEVERVKKSS